MKKKNSTKPTRSKLPILRQLCNLIPPHLVPKVARETGVDKKARTFSPWSHLVSMLYAQLVHCISLNDICDTLRSHCEALSTIRGASAPSRNGLSNANRVRNADMAEDLFWNDDEQSGRENWHARKTWLLRKLKALPKPKPGKPKR